VIQVKQASIEKGSSGAIYIKLRSETQVRFFGRHSGRNSRVSSLEDFMKALLSCFSMDAAKAKEFLAEEARESLRVLWHLYEKEGI
jgi:predicted RNA-binding Zn ribbon-like protein